MGCLDPKMDKARTFELLRAKGAVRAEVPFSGGHDEGWFETIELTMADGSQQSLEHWYCGGYGMENVPGGGYSYVPLNVPANDDEELADLLGGPVDQRFGSWGGVPSTSGRIIWEVEKEEVKIDYTQDEPTEHYERVSF